MAILQFNPKYVAESAAAGPHLKTQGRIDRFQENPEVEVAIVARGSLAIFSTAVFSFFWSW